MGSMESSKGYPMKGGEGMSSYTNNSSYQKSLSDVAMSLMSEAIAAKLDVGACGSPFRVADLGCSVGPNTLIAVENIINCVRLKYDDILHQQPEFQVLFNDHALNDFNTLFKSLPSNKQYYAAGVPGSFYTRLFPKASLHVIHSSLAFQSASRGDGKGVSGLEQRETSLRWGWKRGGHGLSGAVHEGYGWLLKSSSRGGGLRWYGGAFGARPAK